MPKIKIYVSGYKCNNCKNRWIPRSYSHVPRICPKCHSSRWNLEKKTKKFK